MRRILLYLILFACGINAYAEDVVQAVPFRTEPGYTADQDKYFLVRINSADSVKAVQMVMTLPEGLHVNTSREGGAVELVGAMLRAEGSHEVDYNVIDGQLHVIVYSPMDVYLNLLGGNLLKVYYTTDATLTDGFHGIYTTGEILGKTSVTAVRPADASSCCYVNPEASDVIDLNELTDLVPSFVCEGLNAAFKDHRSDPKKMQRIDMMNATTTKGLLRASNGNALIYMRADSRAALMQSSGDSCNVVEINNSNQLRARHIILRDSDGDLYVPQKMKIDALDLNRQFEPGQNSTICLPVDATEDDINSLISIGVKIYKFVGFDEEKKSLSFRLVHTMQANTPYMVVFNEYNTVMATVRNSEMYPTKNLNTVSYNDCDYTFHGSMTNYELSSDKDFVYYGYDEANGAFRRVGTGVKVKPFRGYFRIPTSKADASLSRIAVTFDDTLDSTTGIANIPETVKGSKASYNLDGTPATNLRRGSIIITNGRKEVVL